jgi:hypothetical protein
MIPQKFKLKKDVGSIVFRAGTQIVSINKETQISEELYNLCCKFGKSHCFDIMGEEKGQKKSLSTSQFPVFLSTLNEVPTDESDLPLVPNKRLEDVSTPQPKKRGRPFKSKD